MLLYLSTELDLVTAECICKVLVFTWIPIYCLPELLCKVKDLRLNQLPHYSSQFYRTEDSCLPQSLPDVASLIVIKDRTSSADFQRAVW